MNRADSKKSESTSLECMFKDRPLELTHLKKSRLEQTSYFDDSELEPTRTKKSQLDQNWKVLNCSFELTQIEESQLDQSIIEKKYASEPT